MSFITLSARHEHQTTRKLQIGEQTISPGVQTTKRNRMEMETVHSIVDQVKTEFTRRVALGRTLGQKILEHVLFII